MKKPLISIITVCYNEKNIEKTCKSVIDQTYKNYEWLVIDGGSKDGTLDILNKYKREITTLISEKDNGIYDAMNKGARMAKGEWLIFMNGGDCFFENNSLEKIFSHCHDVDIIFADGTNNVHNTKHPLPINSEGKIILYKFFCGNSLCHQATYIKKELFDKHGPYDTSYRVIADHVFNYLAFKDLKVSYEYIPETVALVDITGISMSNRDKLESELKRLRKEKFNLIIELSVNIDMILANVLKK